MATAAVPRKQVAADPVAIDAKHYKVEFENDKVRVLRVKYGAKEKSQMHKHPPLVAVFIDPHHCRHTFADGRVEEMRVKAGEVRYMDGTEHAPENLGGPFELVLIELKR